MLLILALACAAWAVLSAAHAQVARAAPAAPDLGTTQQPDGTAFTSRVFGDEWSNGVETASGHTVVQNRTTGAWEYAARTPGNRLRASGRVVGRHLPGSIPKHLRDEVALEQGADLAQEAPLPDPIAMEPAAAVRTQNVGAAVTTHRNLVILASFNDQASLGTTPASWNERFFGESGSLADYYQEVSYGQFAIEPAAESSGTANDGIVDWVALDMPHPNGDMEAARRMVKAAVEAADSTVNFAQFDTDGNGILLPSEMHLTVIAAGLEGSYPGTGKKVWGHRWSLQPTVVDPPVADGVSVANMYYGGGYTAFGEMHNDHQATVGIVAHEFGHDIGLPDLYDTDSSSNGVGKWSVMGSGSWLQTGAAHQGSTPAHADAWSKWRQGWIAPNLLTAATVGQAVNAATSLTNSNVALQLGANPGGPTDWRHQQHAGTGEYFLVENRQRTPGTYDAGLPGEGLLVWHINEAKLDNKTDADRLVDLLEADGLNQLDQADPMGSYRGDAGDPYPGTANNRSVSSTSTPSSRLNVSSAHSGVTIEAISDSAATMTANIHLPTANDAFAAATSITDRSSSRTQRVTEATRQSGESTACGVDRSVWFKYTAPETATIALTTAGTPFDTALGVFTGSNVADLTSVACNGDAAGVTTSALSFAATAGATYYVQVGNDVAAPGGVGDLTLSMQSSPTTPSSVSALAGDASATVTWDAPASDGGSPITGYTVTASPGGVTATAGASADEATVTGLANGTSYTFTVTATNDVGGSAASPASNSVTPSSPATTPDAPTGVTAQRGNGQASVTWTAPASNGGSPITGYTVTASPGGATALADAEDTDATVTGLSNGTPYTFTVTATNDVGDSAASTASNSVTPVVPVTAPGAPLNAWATATEGVTTVGWTQPASNGGAPITGYTVTASPGGVTRTVSGATRQTSINNLVNGTAYTFTVRATNSAGTGIPSAPTVTVRPVATVLPVVQMKAPTALYALTGSLTTTWTATDASGIASHDVRWRRAVPGGTFQAWVYNPAWQGQTTRKALLAASQPGYMYCFSARSKDVAGNVSAWAAARCTTTALDDAALTASTGWTTKSGVAGYYRGTNRSTTLKGATLTLAAVKTKKVWLVATKCLGCGQVAVTVGGVSTVVNLNATTTKRQAVIEIPAATSATARTVRVTIKVLTSGKRVEIDGLAVTSQ